MYVSVSPSSGAVPIWRVLALPATYSCATSPVVLIKLWAEQINYKMMKSNFRVTLNPALLTGKTEEEGCRGEVMSASIAAEKVPWDLLKLLLPQWESVTGS